MLLPRKHDRSRSGTKAHSRAVRRETLAVPNDARWLMVQQEGVRLLPPTKQRSARLVSIADSDACLTGTRARPAGGRMVLQTSSATARLDSAPCKARAKCTRL